jgi:hypothetical protein
MPAYMGGVGVGLYPYLDMQRLVLAAELERV